MARLLQETLPPSQRSDHDLVSAVRRGDESAFEELFSRYRGRIRAYVAATLSDRDQAEDLVQEVFISALCRLRNTERPIAFRPWIYRIAKNACIDELRRARRNHEVPLDRELESPEAACESPLSAPGPEVAIESKQRLEDLRGAFRGVSDLHHQILVLRELEGLSYAEIGERLAMSRAVVESTLFRARRRLTEEYDELMSGRRCAHTRALIDASSGRALHRLGVRERRRLLRHLTHCQPCRRHAALNRSQSDLLAVA